MFDLKNKDGKPLSRSEGEAVLKGLASITITIYAALLAISTLLGSGNSGRVLNNTMTINDTWSFYQAKSIKQSIAEGQLDDAVAAKDTKKIAELKAKIDRYESEPATGEGKRELLARAKALDAERDEAKRRSPYYSFAGTTLQIAIVLSTTAILAVSIPLWYASIVVGFMGSLLMSNGLWLWFSLPGL